jgi:hypothetical protein
VPSPRREIKPALHHRAIPGSKDNDVQIQQRVQESLATYGVDEQLIVPDIEDACDILCSVYDKTDGIDGYVSLYRSA